MTLRGRFAALDDRAARTMGLGNWAQLDTPAVIPGRFVVASVLSMVAVLTGGFLAMFGLTLGGGRWLAWIFVAPPVASFVAVIAYARGRGRRVGIVVAVVCAIPAFAGMLFGDHAWHGDLGWGAAYGIGFLLQALGVVLCRQQPGEPNAK